MRIAIKLAYDGTKYHGFARQPNLNTVEGELIENLIKEEIITDPKDSVFRAASRTDKNVSALGNVVAFNTDIQEKEILERLSENFENILIYASKKVDLDFYPRYAKLRHYRYFLPNQNLGIQKIIHASSFFTGEHDFSNFARIEEGKNPVRAIENIIFEEQDDFLIINFFAQTFLWHQLCLFPQPIKSLVFACLIPSFLQKVV